jgi:hypothetical protein
MNNSSFARVKSFGLSVALFVVFFAFVPASRVQAQLPDELLKLAGAVPLTTALIDSVDKFVKAVGADPAAKAEWDTAGKDPNMTAEKVAEALPKYPKLAAAFKSAGLAPVDFMNAMSAIVGSTAAAEMANGGADAGTDKTVQANIAFYKANKTRCAAIMNSIDAIEKSVSSSSAPASSPVASP